MPRTFRELSRLEARIRMLLPEQYQECYDEVSPISMGSASLKYTADGRVAWDEIWGSFCDLAMAGGPPHRGTLLEPASAEEIALHPQQYTEVAEEICRAIWFVSEMAARPSIHPGWIDVHCRGRTMAGWLTRAINMENVSAHCSGTVIQLPVGPHFRIAREIKNVVTSFAKTSHYWLEHTSSAQHRAIAKLFARKESQSPLLQPPFPALEPMGIGRVRQKIFNAVTEKTGLRPALTQSKGWAGIDVESVPAAIWVMRAAAASNVLCRREETNLYLPANPALDLEGARVVGTLTHLIGLAREAGAL